MNKLFLVLLALNCQAIAQAQNVAINNDGSAPNPGAILDIKSSTKGLLIPRTSTATRSAMFTGPNGLLFYDTTAGSFWFLNGGVWIETGRIDIPNNNTFFGYQSGKAFPTGDFNSGFGHEALFSNTTGIGNTALGLTAMHTNTTGNYNTAAGMFALYFNTTGSNNTAIGNNALILNQTGYSNVAVGSGALFHNSAGKNHVAIGDSALFNSDNGFNNLAIGSKAGFANTTGQNNSFVGGSSGYSNTTGQGNSFMGSRAGYANISGKSNCFFGDSCGVANSSGDRNTYMGYEAGAETTTGYNNCFFGEEAGRYNITGNHLTMIGSNANALLDNLSYATGVGYNARVGCSNCLVLGGTTSLGDQTRVGINNSTPLTDLHIVQQSSNNLDNTRGIRLQSPNGNQWRVFLDPSNNYIFQYNNNLYSYIEPVGGAFVNPSDERLKKDIYPLDNVLDKTLQLQAKTYHYTVNSSTDRHSYGFLAQDVEKLFPEFVFTSETGYKGIAYSNFSVIAIKAIQEQQEIIKALQIQVEAAKAEIPMQIGKQQQQIEEQKQKIDQQQNQINEILKELKELRQRIEK